MLIKYYGLSGIIRTARNKKVKLNALLPFGNF
ncbi:MAG: hypothetical protein PWR10_1507 [Halanaerobiales bacterium]|nr:hypothetical protein [Halanaerobiales bacterium]